jgi:hypothetical protein
MTLEAARNGRPPNTFLKAGRASVPANRWASLKLAATFLYG